MKFYDKNGRIHDKWIHAIWSNITTKEEYNNVQNITVDPYDDDFDDDDIDDDDIITPSTSSYQNYFKCACGTTMSYDRNSSCPACGTKCDIPMNDIPINKFGTITVN